MVEVQVRRPVAPADVAELRELATLAEHHDGRPALGDAVWRDLAHPGAATALVAAIDAGHLVGGLPIGAARPGHDEALVGGLVVAPTHRAGGVAPLLLEAVITDALARAAAHVEVWAFGADVETDAAATGGGFHVERELWQMRAPLPVAEAPRWPAGIDVRPFRVGEDEAAWLEVNNRAFAHDPDQGDWTLDTLQARAAESWFDPEDFLLAVDDAGLAGFCWTKLHEPTPPVEPERLGEIYVIGVDPHRQGTGLGRALVLGGLGSLVERGAAVGMLFVDAANTPATELYRALGFTVARVDRAYGRAVS